MDSNPTSAVDTIAAESDDSDLSQDERVIQLAFMDLVERDIVQNPDRIEPLTPEILARAKAALRGATDR
jgi:hypothetical protein